MKLRKTLTTAKIEANRLNSKRSTGPRTQRGKRTTKYNAVTLGLFAKHIVIPICDGYEAEKDFKSLLDGLNQDFQPVGFYEEWLVVKIAECIWRLRRATRCESGSVRLSSAIWDGRPIWTGRENTERSLELMSEACGLEQAEKELRESGSLSEESYQQVLPLVEEKRKSIQPEKLVEADFDRQEFLDCITERKESCESHSNALDSIEGKLSDARFDYDALARDGYMDRIFRYEERMHKQIDWAVERLLANQERR